MSSKFRAEREHSLLAPSESSTRALDIFGIAVSEALPCLDSRALQSAPIADHIGEVMFDLLDIAATDVMTSVVQTEPYASLRLRFLARRCRSWRSFARRV